MNRYMSMVCSVIFVLLLALPCRVSAASITETKAAIGKDCVASGTYSTAMGYLTTASGNGSTAMGGATTASGFYSIAMGIGTTASDNCSTVIGNAFDETHRLVNNIPDSFMVAYMASETDTRPDFFVKDGAVGIGTKTPQNLLDLGQTLGKKLALYQGTGFYNFYGFGISSATLEIYAAATSEASSPAMVVKDTGNVGIGKTFPAYKLDVAGDAAKTSGGTTWINSSFA